MKVPSHQEINKIKQLISYAIKQLIQNDSDIFINTLLTNESRRKRELHEVTICHRLAVYLEMNLDCYFQGNYSVDLEYNRNYDEVKRYWTGTESKIARPDIIIHTRTHGSLPQHQHLLVIEAKKGKVPSIDINKVKGFIADRNYFYLFGLTISYCYTPGIIEAMLYYCTSECEVISEDVSENIV